MAYQAAQAYDFDMFESRPRSSAAPAAAPRRDNIVPLKVPAYDKNRKEENARAVKNASASGRAAVTIMLVAIIIFSAVCMQVMMGAKKYELSVQIQQLESKIEIARSENVRLTAELNGIKGIGKIDDYATSILGMTKVENYQIKCIDLSEGDKIIYSRGLNSLDIGR